MSGGSKLLSNQEGAVRGGEWSFTSFILGPEEVRHTLAGDQVDRYIAVLDTEIRLVRVWLESQANADVYLAMFGRTLVLVTLSSHLWGRSVRRLGE
ncbi:hypothetical protein NPIL_330771 [Nephila pilipes]|uniref:Uncharacterized protein n=1 Tax=Nephila pilipes TaxID=299642 RepID=A0A8X6PYL5_NEPPI|nr:hypothetical protein NPIL_330771 [Nephila pilipes]